MRTFKALSFVSPLMRRNGVIALAVLALAGAAGATTAKEFQPGDLRVCGAARCVGITNRAVLPKLSSFYYLGPTDPRPTGAPALGARMYELRFRNGYVTGVVATRNLDRFLSYGVNTTRFRGAVWYAVPASLAREFRRLAARLRPLYVTRAALARSPRVSP
jgi:hypothetical protein